MLFRSMGGQTGWARRRGRGTIAFPFACGGMVWTRKGRGQVAIACGGTDEVGEEEAGTRRRRRREVVVVASSSSLRHCVVSEASEDKGEGKGKGASSRRPHRVVMLVVLVEALKRRAMVAATAFACRSHLRGEGMWRDDARARRRRRRWC